ncbi:hypothetical protein [Bacillus nitroreducens]
MVICLSIFLTAGCSGGSNQTQGENSEVNANPNEESSDTIKIGVIVSKTGPASALGKPEADVIHIFRLYRECHIEG